MMALLSGLLTGAVGKYASSLTIPALIFGSLILGHQFLQQRDAKLQAQATNVCDSNWESQIRKQERDVANGNVAAAQSLLEGERKVNEDLRNELSKVGTTIEELRAASSGDDDRCLSDSVLRSLGGPGSDLNGRSSKARPRSGQ